ncbi:MAG: hypothetical protein U0587_02195 [Candidatus Binatia bacterium]
MRAIRHLIVWSLLIAAGSGWIAAIPRCGGAAHASAAATPWESTYDIDAPAIPRALSIVLGRPHTGVLAVSVASIRDAARPPHPPIRGVVARSGDSRHSRIALHDLLRIYRI